MSMVHAADMRSIPIDHHIGCKMVIFFFVLLQSLWNNNNQCDINKTIPRSAIKFVEFVDVNFLLGTVGHTSHRNKINQ